MYNSGTFDVTFGVGDTSTGVSINLADDEQSEISGLVTDDTPDLVEIVDPMNATGIIDDDEIGMYDNVIRWQISKFDCNG